MPTWSRRCGCCRPTFRWSSQWQATVRFWTVSGPQWNRIPFSGNDSGSRFRGDVADLIDAADFIVHPSHEDALPTALISALAGAKPIVATNVGGIPDIVGPGCGTLVESGNPAALGSGIAEMASAALHDSTAFADMRQRPETGTRATSAPMYG